MKPFKLLCPSCQGEQNCPCDSCQNTDKVTWKWITGNGPIMCGYCGLTMPEWEWLKEEYYQYEQWQKSLTPAQHKKLTRG